MTQRNIILELVDFDDLARTSVKMAKIMNLVRPEVVALPLRSGVVAGNLTMEAMRSALEIKADEYDPAIFPVVLKYNSAQPESRCQINQIHETLGNNDFKSIYPDFRKMMIIDYTICGESVSSYLCAIKDNLSAFGKVHVNLMASDRSFKQEREFGYYDHFSNKNLQIYFNRLKSPEIVFDNQDRILGLTCTECYDYVPMAVQESKTFYRNFKKALDNIKD
ncbi:MAG: hypothetical protein V1678_04680 [Candidatus Aenigmatarchaeota archaeon]